MPNNEPVTDWTQHVSNPVSLPKERFIRLQITATVVNEKGEVREIPVLDQNRPHGFSPQDFSMSWNRPLEAVYKEGSEKASFFKQTGPVVLQLRLEDWSACGRKTPAGAENFGKSASSEEKHLPTPEPLPQVMVNGELLDVVPDSET